MQTIVQNIIIESLHKTYPNASIGKGGSVATGIYHPDSDIDIFFQHEELKKSFIISFIYEGFSTSIIGIDKSYWSSHEIKYLYGYHNMPFTYIDGVIPVYDNKKIINNLKKQVEIIRERRVILSELLISTLKGELNNILKKEKESVVNEKEKVYIIIEKIISIFYLKNFPDRLTQKREGRNPYNMIKKISPYLYQRLKECLPYTQKSYCLLEDLLSSNFL